MDKELAHIKLENECREFFASIYKDHVNPVIYGHGSLNPRVMLVGGWPSLADMTAAEPMHGQRHLKELLDITGLNNGEVYLTYAVKSMAPGHKRPNTEQCELSKPHLFDEIELLSPRLIVAMGETACRCLTGAAVLRVTDAIEARIAGKNRIVYAMRPLSAAARGKTRALWLEQARALGEYIISKGI